MAAAKKSKPKKKAVVKAAGQDMSRKSKCAYVGDLMDSLPHEDRVLVMLETIRLLNFQLSQSAEESVSHNAVGYLEDAENALEEIENYEYNKQGWIE